MAEAVTVGDFEHRAAVPAVPPHSLEAERSVLGACLLEAQAIVVAMSIVAAEDFWRTVHRWLFGAMVRLQARGAIIDYVTLREELNSQQFDEIQPAYITALMDGVPRSSNVEHYARIVKEKALLRRLIGSATQVISAAHGEEESPAVILDDAQQAFRAIADQAAGAEQPISTSLAVVLERVSTVTTPRHTILGDLLALDEIAMLHGAPRDGKTWVADELAVALALADRAFGLERLTAETSRGVLIVSNEDSERVTAGRVRMLLSGRGVLNPPQNIHLIVGQGCDLDAPVWQRRLIHEIQRLGVALVILDPLRSLTACVDQGPHELQPFALFLRRVLRETGVALLLVHHDVKPAAGVTDTRRRAQKASGGGIFSIVDSPLHVERIDEQRSLVAPDGFKFCADPESFVFERSLSTDGNAIQLVATDTGTAATANDIALQAKIQSFLRDSPGRSGRQIASGVKVHKQAVADALERMFLAGLVDAVDGARKARLWSLR